VARTRLGRPTWSCARTPAWALGRAGVTDLSGLIHRSHAGSQYVSLALTERLAALGMRASIGTVADAYDTALAESTIGLFKTELIRRRGPWRTLDDVEIATLEWVDWFNIRRLHTRLGDIPPAEHEAADYRQNLASTTLETREPSGVRRVPWSQISGSQATVIGVLLSNSMGVSQPMAEWRRWRLWKTSRYSKIALASSRRVRQRWRFSS
jgi:hypothetical protein